MFRKFLCCLAAAVCSAALLLPAAAAEVESGSVYCFRAEDFSQETVLTGICVTSLPEGGMLLLGGRKICAGDILTAEQAAQLTFSPIKTEDDRETELGYLPVSGGHVREPAVLTLSIRGKADKAPIAEDEALETYKNLELTGKLKVTDPEGQSMTYTVVRQPKRGTLVLHEDGSFTYTPKKNKVGVDSFVYTATDPAGKTSREATVTVTILRPTDATQYTDTAGQDCRFAAEWMKNTGIFVGETLSGHLCFHPDKTVTKGEFVTMLVRALELPVDSDITETGYTEEIPLWLQPYLAAAVRAGLTACLEDPRAFDADSAITFAEASSMLQILLDMPAETFGGEDALSVLPLTRASAAKILYQAARTQTEPEPF